MQYGAAMAFVMVTGVVAYLISGHIEQEDFAAPPSDTPLEWKVQVIGWISALLYREWELICMRITLNVVKSGLVCHKYVSEKLEERQPFDRRQVKT